MNRQGIDEQEYFLYNTAHQIVQPMDRWPARHRYAQARRASSYIMPRVEDGVCSFLCKRCGASFLKGCFFLL